MTTIDRWVRNWSELWNTPELEEKIRFEPGPRLRRSLGRCHPRTGRVRLHPALFDGPESFLKEVVCHEAAHVAVHLLHDVRVRPHGKEWAALMRAAGYEPRARMAAGRLPDALRVATRPPKLYGGFEGLLEVTRRLIRGD